MIKPYRSSSLIGRTLIGRQQRAWPYRGNSIFNSSPTIAKGWMKKLVQPDSAKNPTIYRDPGAKLAKQYGIPMANYS